MTARDDLRSAADVDADWLTAVLHDDGVDRSARVVDVEARSIGTGQVGENVRFELTWEPADPDLPASVVGKFPSASEVSRTTAVHLDTYAREIGFYRDLQSEVSIRTPHVHHIGWDPASHDFVLIMEDIVGARQGDQIAGCTLAEAELAVDQAVGLHAPLWGRTERLRALGWLNFPDAERTERMTGITQWAFPGFAERFAGRLADRDLAVGRDLIDRYGLYVDQIERWATTHGWSVVHADYRLDNMLFGGSAPSAALVVVDWQTVAIGIGPSDVAYFCGAGLLPEQRRGGERSLVERYAAGLRSHGVEIDDDEAWVGYTLGAASGYLMAVIASQLVEQTERGDEMFAVMAERHADQIGATGLLDRL